VVEGLDPVGATLADTLGRQLPKVLAVDCPLGVPQGLAKLLVGLAANGSQVLERLVASPPAELDTTWARFATECPGALRLTDALTHGAPSVTSPRPPVWRSLRALARILSGLRDRVALVPFDTLELLPTRSMVLEALPTGTLRLLGLPYLSYRGAPEGGPAPSPSDSAAARMQVLTGLPAAVGALGFRLEVPAFVVNACVTDTHGDALDAVLCCVTAALATRGLWAPPPYSGPLAARVQLEGWIVRPGA
jgi:hypothetical protein